MNTSPTYTNASTRLQRAALITGIAFLAVGILGFIPGVTSDFDEMTFAGHHSGAMLLGIFEVSVLHNIVHLLFGVIGIAASRTSSRASYSYLLYGGIIYFALFLYGMFVGHDSSSNFVPVNDADNALHFFLSVGMVGAALALRSRSADMSRQPGSLAS